MRSVFVLLALVLTASPGSAQDPPGAQHPPAAPGAAGGVTASGSLRTRVEAWDWFAADANHDYTFSGSLLRLAIAQSRKRIDWQVELAAPLLLGLPDAATAAGAQGQLGLGASYFAANAGRRNASMLFVKQGYARLRAAGQALTLGRMEFIDGTEALPNNPTLAALTRERIAHRLLGDFGFSHVGRSFDGVRYSATRPKWNLTALAARPTQGVFQANGWSELSVNVYYGALTRQVVGTAHAASWRLFGLGYSDYRHGVLKTDNRPLAARRSDTGRIDIFTFGGHYIDAVPTTVGVVDVLAWGAAQTGSWGSLSQRSGAFAAEAGWQPAGRSRLRPWIRGGYDFGSGDGRATDTTHGTFFQVLPTPRLYARFPFFNMMNTADAFAELVLRPSPGLTIRSDIHALRLADANDLWYLGGGAFQAGTFGYVGRPSNGGTGLATLSDASANLTITPRISINGYVGHAAGGPVTAAVYPQGHTATYGYLELLWLF